MNTGRIDRSLLAARWPDQKKIEQLKLQPGDVLLVCGGFEDRAMTVINMAASAKSSGITVLDFEYAPLVDQNHFPQISQLCEDVGWQHIPIAYDRCNPSAIFDSVVTHLPSDLCRLYIDISGMSRLLIVQLIVGFLEQGADILNVSILYTEAVTYPPSESDAHATLSAHANDFASILSFISVGVYDLAIVPELSSINLNRAPIRLIAFPSFNPTQFFSVKSIIQPAKTTLIHGVPPVPELGWRTEVIRQLNMINDDVGDQQLEIGTLDYAECLRSLLNLYNQWAEFNSLVISPSGSKMQTVAVGIFRAFMRDVQIIYPTPLRFSNPKDHTHGAKQVYELKLDSFISLRNDLLATAFITQ